MTTSRESSLYQEYHEVMEVSMCFCHAGRKTGSPQKLSTTTENAIDKETPDCYTEEEVDLMGMPSVPLSAELLPAVGSASRKTRMIVMRSSYSCGPTVNHSCFSFVVLQTGSEKFPCYFWEDGVYLSMHLPV